MNTSAEESPREGDGPDLMALRQQITNVVCAAALPMVEKTIAEVQSGHYQALKYLFEMIGLYPATGAHETPEEDSLAKTLLRHLGISEEGMGVSKNRDSESRLLMLGGDAVK